MIKFELWTSFCVVFWIHSSPQRWKEWKRFYFFHQNQPSGVRILLIMCKNSPSPGQKLHRRSCLTCWVNRRKQLSMSSSWTPLRIITVSQFLVSPNNTCYKSRNPRNTQTLKSLDMEIPRFMFECRTSAMRRFIFCHDKCLPYLHSANQTQLNLSRNISKAEWNGFFTLASFYRISGRKWSEVWQKFCEVKKSPFVCWRSSVPEPLFWVGWQIKRRSAKKKNKKQNMEMWRDSKSYVYYFIVVFQTKLELGKVADGKKWHAWKNYQISSKYLIDSCIFMENFFSIIRQDIFVFVCEL